MTLAKLSVAMDELSALLGEKLGEHVITSVNIQDTLIHAEVYTADNFDSYLIQYDYESGALSYLKNGQEEFVLMAA